MNCRLPAGTIPVLFEADVAVVGGSFAGVSCALRLAAAGRKVVVIESRTYLGRELTATLRPWIELGAGTGTGSCGEPPGLVARLLSSAAVAAEPEEATDNAFVPLHADRLKRELEDALLERGVELLYASYPIQLVERDGRPHTLVVANKSGRQAIRCRAVVDATETALVAALVGRAETTYGPGERALYYRTLEFTDADEALPTLTERTAPSSLGLAEDRIRLRRGAGGPGHVFVEYAMALPSANAPAADRERTLAARRAGMRLASHLVHNEPAFRKAFLASSSFELHGPFPIGDQGGAAGGSPAEETRSVPAFDASYGASPEGVWSLGLALFRRGDVDLLDAVRASALGERAAEAANALLERLDFPSEAGGSDAASDRASRAEAELAVSKDGASVESAAPAFDGASDSALVSTLGLATASVTAPTSASSASDAVVAVPSLVRDADARPGVFVPEQAVDASSSSDVLVVGGGSSGACAAITAAKEGVRSALFDMNPGLGGTGTFGGVDSYWFGKRYGFAGEIAERVAEAQRDIGYKGHKWNIEAKMYALQREAERAGVELTLQAVTFGAIRQGDRVRGVVAATRWGVVAAFAEAVVDATGDGDIAAYAGADFVYGSEKDHTVMWYSLAQFQSPGRTKNNFTSMVDVSDALDYTRAILAGRRRGDGCHDHGIYVATRESRHIVGDVTMKLSDQLLQRRWPDAVNVHFSNHDVKGVSGAAWVNVGLIPPNLEIEIPYRMLLPKGVEGLLVAGKALSATHDALPAIRMQSDLENLGGIAAIAAAMAARTGDTPRRIDVRVLQARAVRAGLLPETVLTRSLSPIRYSDEELDRLVDAIETNPLYDYADMRMNEVHRGPIPFAEICSLGRRAVGALERALPTAEGVKRVRIAQALAMLGSTSGVPALVEALTEALRGDALPIRTAEIMYVQLPPDHGAMPDAAYLLYSLASAPDVRAVPVWERVAELLRPEEDDFKDSRAGVFYYIDAVCQGAERLGDRAAVPALRRLRRIPAIRDQQSADRFQPDYFRERRAMLELAVGRALARCGDEEGYRVLIAYLADSRSLLAKSALLELRRLSGLPGYGVEPTRWQAWLEETKPYARTAPLKLRLDVENDSETVPRRE